MVLIVVLRVVGVVVVVVGVVAIMVGVAVVVGIVVAVVGIVAAVVGIVAAVVGIVAAVVGIVAVMVGVAVVGGRAGRGWIVLSGQEPGGVVGEQDATVGRQPAAVAGWSDEFVAVVGALAVVPDTLCRGPGYADSGR